MSVLAAPFDIGLTGVEPGNIIRMKMAAVKIYRGGAVGVIIGTGYATPMVIATSGMKFVGIALETVDNSAGSAGDLWIRVQFKGLAAFNNGNTLTVAHVGKMVYFVSGTDDNSVTDTAGNIPAGELKTVDSNGVLWVEIGVATNGVLFYNTTDQKIYAQGYGIKSAAMS